VTSIGDGKELRVKSEEGKDGAASAGDEGIGTSGRLRVKSEVLRVKGLRSPTAALCPFTLYTLHPRLSVKSEVLRVKSDALRVKSEGSWCPTATLRSSPLTLYP
jgi:hypothetical protein